jgi:hypothetical protein
MLSMPIRPESQRRLREGFQRRVDEQRRRYAEQLAQAERLAAAFGYGDVIGIFSMEERADEFGESPIRYGFWGLLPLFVGLPLLIAAAAARIRGVLILMIAWPFVTGAWFLMVSLWAHRRKGRVWLYVLADGFVTFADFAPEPKSARWDQIANVQELWHERFDPSSEEMVPVLMGYRVQTRDGRDFILSRLLRNMLDPYAPVGRFLTAIVPASVGEVIPRFPVIDEIIATHAKPHLSMSA